MACRFWTALRCSPPCNRAAPRVPQPDQSRRATKMKPNFANAGRRWAKFYRLRSNLGRTRAISGQVCSNLGQIWPKSCQVRPIAGQFWSMLGGCLSKFAFSGHIRSIPGRSWSKFANFGSNSLEVGGRWLEFGRIRSLSAPFRPNPTGIRPKLNDLGQSPPGSGTSRPAS